MLITLVFWAGIKDSLYAWELESLTFRQRLFSLPPKDRSRITPITLVTFDTKTSNADLLDRFFGTPLSRSAHGHLVRFFKRARTKAVVFDMSFNGGIHYNDLAGDDFFVKSLKGTDQFISSLIFNWTRDPSLAYNAHPPDIRQALDKNTVRVEGIDRFPVFMNQYSFSSLAPPFPDLLSQSDMKFYPAKGSVFKASTDDTADNTGDSRRWLPFAYYGGKVYPNLALGAVLGAHKTLRLSKEGQLTWPGGSVDMGPDGLPLIKWHGHQAYINTPIYPEVSYIDVLVSELVLACREKTAPETICREGNLPSEPPVRPEIFKDRYVLIGFNIPRSEDMHQTIYSPRYPGVYILANTLDNLLHDDFVHPAPWWLNTLFFLVLPGLLLVIIFRFRSVWISLLMTLTLAAGYFLLCIYAYNQLNLWVAAVYPILAMLLCFTGAYIYSYLQTEKKRQQMRYAFGKYVSPAVMAIIERNPDKITLGGERREMSFLFSDIRGFTTFSEQNAPETVQAFLTDYFSGMNGIILNRFNGSINKLIGDAIMAYWGFPLENEDHAFLAVCAALAMQEQMKSWQDDPSHPPIHIGIGINTGDAMIGNVGSEDFMDFTVIGDAVNVASRLEGLNKQFGTSIIISAATYEKVRDRIEARSLGWAEVKGKSGQIEVFEPLGLKMPVM